MRFRELWKIAIAFFFDFEISWMFLVSGPFGFCWSYEQKKWLGRSDTGLYFLFNAYQNTHSLVAIWSFEICFQACNNSNERRDHHHDRIQSQQTYLTNRRLLELLLCMWFRAWLTPGSNRKKLGISLMSGALRSESTNPGTGSFECVVCFSPTSRDTDVLLFYKLVNFSRTAKLFLLLVNKIIPT